MRTREGKRAHVRHGNESERGESRGMREGNTNKSRRGNAKENGERESEQPREMPTRVRFFWRWNANVSDSGGASARGEYERESEVERAGIKKKVRKRSTRGKYEQEWGGSKKVGRGRARGNKFAARADRPFKRSWERREANFWQCPAPINCMHVLTQYTHRVVLRNNDNALCCSNFLSRLEELTIN